MQGIILTKYLQCDKYSVRLYEVQKKFHTFILKHAQIKEVPTLYRMSQHTRNITDDLNGSVKPAFLLRDVISES